MKTYNIGYVNKIIDSSLLVIITVIAILPLGKFEIEYFSNSFIEYFVRLSSVLLAAFALGESFSTIYWYRLKKANRQKMQNIFSRLAVFSNLLFILFACIFFGTAYSIFRTIGENVIPGLFAVLLGGLFGFSFNIEMSLELTIDSDREKRGRKIFDHSINDNLSYFLLYPLVYLPLSWLNQNSSENKIVIYLFDLVLIWIIYFLGNILNKNILKDIEIKKKYNSIKTVITIICLSFLSTSGFLLWDYLSIQIVKEDMYAIPTKVFLLIFTGFAPIRAMTILLSENKQLSKISNLIILVVYSYLKVIRI